MTDALFVFGVFLLIEVIAFSVWWVVFKPIDDRRAAYMQAIAEDYEDRWEREARKVSPPE